MPPTWLHTSQENSSRIGSDAFIAARLAGSCAEQRPLGTVSLPRHPERVARLAALLDAHNAQQSPPAWPFLIEAPTPLDLTLRDPYVPGEEVIYCPNEPTWPAGRPARWPALRAGGGPDSLGGSPGAIEEETPWTRTIRHSSPHAAPGAA